MQGLRFSSLWWNVLKIGSDDCMILTYHKSIELCEMHDVWVIAQLQNGVGKKWRCIPWGYPQQKGTAANRWKRLQWGSNNSLLSPQLSGHSSPCYLPGRQWCPFPVTNSACLSFTSCFMCVMFDVPSRRGGGNLPLLRNKAHSKTRWSDG